MTPIQNICLNPITLHVCKNGARCKTQSILLCNVLKGFSVLMEKIDNIKQHPNIIKENRKLPTHKNFRTFIEN